MSGDAGRGGECQAERRALLRAAALAGTAGAVAGLPLAAYLGFPGLQPGRGAWVDVGRADGLRSRGTRMLRYKVTARDGWMVRPREGVVWARTDAGGALTVFSAVCPHLGCTVRWRDDRGAFECPCHTAQFDADGHPVSGPPRRPLEVLPHRVEDGNLHVLLPA